MKFFRITICMALSFFMLEGRAQKFSFDKEWKFILGDIKPPEIKTHGDSYANAKAGKAWGAAAPEFNDNDWRTLNIPHDWASESSFDSTENVSQGYRKRGIGWYRKAFKLDEADNGKHLELQFDGIATNATVWFNGTVVHRSWSGYTSSYIDITSMAKYGNDINTVAIRVDADVMEGWWYEGAGMYRHSWLVKRSPVHIKTDGVYANPVKISGTKWRIPVEVTVYNAAEQKEKVTVTSKLIDQSGKQIAAATGAIEIAELDDNIARYFISVDAPQLWTLNNPTMYQVVTTIKQQDKTLDEIVTPCGFRTIRFDVNTGFHLNDESVKLQGVCMHQDHAGVGVALPDALWEFRLTKLKELGVNAYRCSHNAPPKKLLQLCDSLGILVMDENRNFNVSPECMNQLEWLVRRDRNHPSVILWSVFNEEPMQGTKQGYEMVRRMSALVKSLDTTRPVTAAMNGGLFTKKNVSDAVDVVGFNYQIALYDKFRKENPTKILTSSEDISSFQIRGEYHTNRSKNIVDDYDTEAAPWGSTQRVGWEAIAERPWLAGSFIWTGFDYHGEPTPFTWPTNSSVFGLYDLCGFPKNAAFIKQAQWRKDIPVLHLVPHWNWPADSIGKKIHVMVSSNADEVELFLNKKSQGRQIVDKYQMNNWQVPFAPGELATVAYKNGKKIGTKTIETTGKGVTLKLESYKTSLNNNGSDATPITVKILDAKGREVPTANNIVHFTINEKAKIIGLGNGNPNSLEPEKGNKRSLFNGLAQVIIQSTENASGNIELTANAEGLKPATIKIALNDVPPVRTILAAGNATVLTDFRMAPFTSKKPDPQQKLSDNDMNSWQPVKPGELAKFDGGNFTLFSTVFELNDLKKEKRETLKITQLTGKAELWLNGQLIGKKETMTTGDITVPFDGKSEKNSLVIVVNADAGTMAGLGGTIEVLP